MGNWWRSELHIFLQVESVFIHRQNVSVLMSWPSLQLRCILWFPCYSDTMFLAPTVCQHYNDGLGCIFAFNTSLIGHWWWHINNWIFLFFVKSVNILYIVQMAHQYLIVIYTMTNRKVIGLQKIFTTMCMLYNFILHTCYPMFQNWWMIVLAMAMSDKIRQNFNPMIITVFSYNIACSLCCLLHIGSSVCFTQSDLPMYHNINRTPSGMKHWSIFSTLHMPILSMLLYCSNSSNYVCGC